MARPSSYTPELGRKVCEAIACSKKGLRGTLEADPDLPELHVVQYWQQNHASFSSDYAQAKRLQLEAMADDIVDISQDESLDANDKRVRIDTLKWLLSKLIPKTFGDKIDVTSGGERLAPPAHQIDARIQSIIMQAQQRKAGGKELLEGLPPEAIDLLG